MLNRKTFLLILLTAALSACGGGSGESATPGLPSNGLPSTSLAENEQAAGPSENSDNQPDNQTDTVVGQNSDEKNPPPSDTGNDTNPDDNNNTNTVNVSSTNPGDYTWASLTSGTRVYIDRNYTYSTIPAAYEGFKVLQTANDDKQAVNDAFVSFDIDNDATIHVAHYATDTARPAWLADWNDTNDVLVTTDRTLYIYSKVFSAGTVVLGGNEGDSSSSMYVVIVDAAGNDGGGGSGGNSAPTTVTLTWNQNPDTILGYKIYMGPGPAPESAVSLRSTINIPTVGFDPAAPSLTYTVDELGLASGDTVCFRIKAFNTVGDSDYSSGLCKTVP